MAREPSFLPGVVPRDGGRGGDAANGRAFKIVATISVTAVAILSATVLVQSILSGLGIS